MRRAWQAVLDQYNLTLRGVDHRGGHALTDRGPYQVRRFPGSLPELQFVAAALAHVESRGFTSLRRLVPTCDGEPGVRLGTGLFYLVEGEPGRRFEAGRRGDLSRAAAVLAAFHRAGEGLPQMEQGERNRLGRWPGLLQDRHAGLQLMRREAVHSRGEFPRLFAEYADDFLEQADRALTGLLSAPLDEVREDCAARRRLAHRRFTPGRLRRLGLELLVDGWAHLALDIPAVDLATFLKKAAGNDPEQAYAFLEAYHDELPLSEPEWEVLLAWLRFPHAFWRLGHLHFRHHETHRGRLSKVIKQEVEREVYVEALALQWVARKLAPAAAAGVILPETSLPERDFTSKDEEEAIPVPEEPDEMMALGVLEGDQPGEPGPEEPGPEEPGPEEPGPEEPSQPWTVEELLPEAVDLSVTSPLMDLSAASPSVETPEEVLEVPPLPMEEPGPEEPPPPPLMDLVETPAVEVTVEETRVIVWKAFPPPFQGDL